MRDERRRVAAAAAVALLGVLAVASVALAGPIHFTPPQWRFVTPQLPEGTAEPRPSASAVPVPPSTAPDEFQRVVTLLLLLALCVGAAVLLYRILRRLGEVRRIRRDAAARRITVATIGEAHPDAPPAAEPIVRGLARALRLLDEPRTADDAIVQAWLGLEEASVASGAGRRPAETPSEYAARVVGRFDADRDAVGVLLGLYQGVRFGGRHPDAGDVAAARESVRRLAASWHDDAAVSGR